MKLQVISSSMASAASCQGQHLEMGWFPLSEPEYEATQEGPLHPQAGPVSG